MSKSAETFHTVLEQDFSDPQVREQILQRADAIIAVANLPASWLHCTVELIDTAGPTTYAVRGKSLEDFNNMVGDDAYKSYLERYVHPPKPRRTLLRRILTYANRYTS